MTNSLRDRSRDILRGQLADAAFDYFAAHGFEAVTVDEVAHAIGISRASFFRYFGSKEDAVVAAVYADHLEFAGILDKQAQSGVSPWWRLRRMFNESIRAAGVRPEEILLRVRLVESTPALRARLNERRLAQRVGVAEILVGGEMDLRTARAMVASAFALVDVAWGEWTENPSSSLSVVLDELFAMMEPRGAQPAERE